MLFERVGDGSLAEPAHLEPLERSQRPCLLHLIGKINRAPKQNPSNETIWQSLNQN